MGALVIVATLPAAGLAIHDRHCESKEKIKNVDVIAQSHTPGYAARLNRATVFYLKEATRAAPGSEGRRSFGSCMQHVALMVVLREWRSASLLQSWAGGGSRLIEGCRRII